MEDLKKVLSLLTSNSDCKVEINQYTVKKYNDVYDEDKYVERVIREISIKTIVSEVVGVDDNGEDGEV